MKSKKKQLKSLVKILMKKLPQIFTPFKFQKVATGLIFAVRLKIMVFYSKHHAKIEEANPNQLAQIFGNAPWADHNKMPPERLEKLVSHFSQRDLSPSKVSNDLLVVVTNTCSSASQMKAPQVQASSSPLVQ
jgi:hypothetical protein